jgi:RNA polymerase sigma-70 factor (ECF subfamily)
MQMRFEHGLFDTLFANEYRGVLALARRIAGSSSAEDIAQEAFAALYRAGPRDPQHARNYVYRAALHRSLSVVKTNRRHRERELRVQPGLAPPQPPELLEQRETREIVQRALRKLKPKYAAALSLRHSGFSYKEIAAMLDVPVARVGVLLMRAEAAIKKELSHVSSSQ